LDRPDNENPTGVTMPKHNRKNSPGPEWKTKWPRNGDLKTWFRAMIRKCDAIPDDEAAGEKAHLPIKHLAEMGYVAEALRSVDRFLRRLPAHKVVARVRIAELGAQICLDADDMNRMEKYLAMAEATEPFNTRKCDKGFSLDSVREFRAENGLLDPADAVEDEQRLEARFSRANRQYKQAMAAGERKSARTAVAEMERVAAEFEEEWSHRNHFQVVLDCYAELKDADSVKRCIRKLDKDDRHEILDADMLVSLGMRAEAIARARRDIAQNLKELRASDDPNIHIPIMAIQRSLTFLVEQQERDEARRWLRRALREMSTWPVVEYGWATSAVYHSLAEVAAIIDGPAAAENLLGYAMTDAKAEKRGGFRQGAIDAALGLKARIGRLDEAIEDARKLRSPTQRRKELGKLLAKAKRWNELRQVLSQVQSPEEAAEVAWWIKFEVPGGEAR
jgi:tetratricopeptide (TPR) repeat protein